MVHNAVCMMCRTKHSLDNELYRMNNVHNEIKRYLTNVSDEQTKAKEDLIRRNPYLLSMLDYHERCSYGIHCSDVTSKVNQINHKNREIAEDLILLSVVDLQAAKRQVDWFRGYYPNAARFIYSIDC